ncbi:hypothetical protein [Kutzneria buriramensis]|uniref:Uncharacterized protein n=1 Tax=Kutzneria buriramensis TaxID=1045776 RepID=A0A3E0HFQ6_9PSEU|nr:hypothetical protein [Kutzneria buriramensis]REH43635.1 hypothetical protein BCF44_109178 [Kutzneria buriramensis]
MDEDPTTAAGRRRGTVLSTVVELAGLAAFVAAGWLIAPWLGLVVAGCALLLIGQALDGAIVPSPAAVWARIPWATLGGWLRRKPAAPAAEPAGVATS